nr:hypothetical protein GCM10020093_057310 [Planobispora longispora]
MNASSAGPRYCALPESPISQEIGCPSALRLSVSTTRHHRAGALTALASSVKTVRESVRLAVPEPGKSYCSTTSCFGPSTSKSSRQKMLWVWLCSTCVSPVPVDHPYSGPVAKPASEPVAPTRGVIAPSSEKAHSTR